MNGWPLMTLLVLSSLALFVAAGLADTYERSFFLAVLAGMVPAAGAVGLTLWSMMRWRRMGARLGLVAGSGAYPDLEGRYQGRRLAIRRRPALGGARHVTAIRLEGHPEVRVPGTLADATAVQQLLEPLLDPQKRRPAVEG